MGSVEGEKEHFLNWNLKKFKIGHLPKGQGSILISRSKGPLMRLLSFYEMLSEF